MLDAATQHGKRRECRERRHLEPAELDVAEDDPDDDHPDRGDREEPPHRRVIGAVTECGGGHGDESESCFEQPGR